MSDTPHPPAAGEPTYDVDGERLTLGEFGRRVREETAHMVRISGGQVISDAPTRQPSAGGTQTLVGWYHMNLAPQDEEILVWCPGRDGLPDMFSKCKWHPDAGFCVDELRAPTCWTWMPKVITWP